MAAMLIAGLAHGEPASVSGPLYIEDVLVVGEGGSLTVLAGTSITGPGHIEVRGSLIVAASITSRAEIAVPIVIESNGTTTLSHARLWGVPGTALTIRGGNLTLTNVSFEGNGVGLAAIGTSPTTIHGQDLLFRAHSSEGARLLGRVTASFNRTAFQDNTRGIVVDESLGGANLTVTQSAFERNGQHVTITMGSNRDPATIRIVETDLGPVSAPSGTRLPSILVRSDLTEGDDANRVVELHNNRHHDADIALRAEGRGYHVDSSNDSFERNRIAASIQGANVTLHHARLNSVEQETEGSETGTLTLHDPIFATSELVTTNLAPRTANWVMPTIILLAATAGGGALVLLQRRKKRGPAQPDEPEQPPAPEVRVDFSIPLKPMERRILDDIVANPGTPQSAVALRLGLSRQALHYHVKKLETRGLLTKRPQGRETQCFVPEDVAASLALSPTVTQADGVEKG